MSIITICYECGFNNLQHFCRMFKDISSMTPGTYRKRMGYGLSRGLLKEMLRESRKIDCRPLNMIK